MSEYLGEIQMSYEYESPKQTPKHSGWSLTYSRLSGISMPESEVMSLGVFSSARPPLSSTALTKELAKLNSESESEMSYFTGVHHDGETGVQET